MGTESTKVHRSLNGWLSCTPSTPKKRGSVRISGKKNSPCRAEDKIEAALLLPIFCCSMFRQMVQPISGKKMHCSRRASVPISVTARSPLRNRPMTCGAKHSPATAISSRPTLATLTQNQNALRTRSYRPAP